MLRVGVLGVGQAHPSSSRRGASLVRQLRAIAGVEVRAVCDLDASALQAFQREFAIPEAYTELAQLLRAALDAIVIATPAPLHAAQAIAALEAGCHVASEVPAACTLQECADLAATVRRSGRQYMLLENYRYLAFIASWRGMVEEGLLGTPIYGEGEYVHDLRWQFKRPDGGRAWRADFPPMQYGTHALGPLLHVFGERCVRATALGTGPRADGQARVSDMEVSLFQLAGGGVLKVLCGFAVARAPKSNYYALYGTRGFIETVREVEAEHAESCQGYFEAIPHLRGLMHLPIGSDLPVGGGRPPAGLAGYPSRDQLALQDFVTAAREGVPSEIDITRALDFTAPCICAHLSAERGGVPVDVPQFR